MSQTLRFYAQPSDARTTPTKVDRKNLAIYGVVAMMTNVEAIGHNLMTDDRSIQMMVELAQEDGLPRRQRFGHPGLSEAATGKQVSRAMNFRVENGHLVHDSFFLPEARKSPAFAQDPVDYILSLAENNPTEFGESVVISCEAVWVLADGTEIDAYADDEEDDGDDWSLAKRPDNAINDLPVIRPTAFHYVDWVNEGAATHTGMFGKERFFKSGASAWAEELFDFVDEFRSTYKIPLNKIPAKTQQLLSAYMQHRAKGDPTMKRSRSALSSKNLAPDEQATPVDVPTEDTSTDEDTEAKTGSEAEAQDSDLQAIAARVQALAERLNAVQAGTALTATLETAEVEYPAFDGLVARVEALESHVASLDEHYQAIIERLQTRFDQVYSTQVTLLSVLEVLEVNQRKLAGEPVVREKVPPVRPLTLESYTSFQPVRPPVLTSLPKPKAMEERSRSSVALSENASPIERSIALQQERAKFANFSTP